MSRHAAGSFDVIVKPLEAYAQDGQGPGRMSLDKQYHGDLEATAKGEMLTGLTAIKDSGVYVAVERVSGSLHGRRGTFMLYHTGVMTRGAQDLRITVVPDSGTGDLTALTGTLAIDITPDGKHTYTLDYTLAEPH